MDMILAGVKWQMCLVYLDDATVFSRSPENHLQHLGEVLTLLEKAGVTLKAAKCQFFQEEVGYLGSVIRPGRVHVLEKNLRDLRGLRYPGTQTKMKSFLGMCGEGVVRIRVFGHIRAGIRMYPRECRRTFVLHCPLEKKRPSLRCSRAQYVNIRNSAGEKVSKAGVTSAIMAAPDTGYVS